MNDHRKPAKPATPPDDPSDPLFGRQPGDDQDEIEKPKSTVLAPQVEQNGAFVGPEKTLRRTALGDEEAQYGKESAVVAAQIKAMIAARTIHALQHPRSFDAARVAILNDCRRPAFAKAAIYKKPVGSGFVEGLSIRFAEAALARWGNVCSDSITLYDDAEKRIVRVIVTDLETNMTHGRDITIPKTTETLTLKPGQEAMSQRVNSQGRITFTVRPTEDKLADIEANHRSKVLRNEGLRLIPPDIKDEALVLCKATRGLSDTSDPAGARKEIVDAFAEIGVLPARLEEYLGCPLDECGPGQLGDLRDVYRAVKDGDAAISDFIEARVADVGDDEPQPNGGKVETLKAIAKAKAAARKAQAKP